MTNTEQYYRGIAAGRDAYVKATKYGYRAWFKRQLNESEALASRYPYAKGYVDGARAAEANAK